MSAFENLCDHALYLDELGEQIYEHIAHSKSQSPDKAMYREALWHVISPFPEIVLEANTMEGKQPPSYSLLTNTNKVVYLASLWLITFEDDVEWAWEIEEQGGSLDRQGIARLQFIAAMLAGRLVDGTVTCRVILP
jgi:hypothetical protein